MGTESWSWHVPWRSPKHFSASPRRTKVTARLAWPQDHKVWGGGISSCFPGNGAWPGLESGDAWSRGEEEEEEAAESRLPREERNVAPVPSGRDLFCIPRRRRLPSPGLRSLPQPPLQGTAMGVRGSPLGWGGDALVGHAEGGDPKKGSFLASPTTPIGFL